MADVIVPEIDCIKIKKYYIHLNIVRPEGLSIPWHLNAGIVNMLHYIPVMLADETLNYVISVYIKYLNFKIV